MKATKRVRVCSYIFIDQLAATIHSLVKFLNTFRSNLKITCTVVELPRSFELELAGVTLCGEANVLSADSDMDMLCMTSLVGVARDAATPLNWERQDTDHGRALLPPRFLRSCTYTP